MSAKRSPVAAVIGSKAGPLVGDLVAWDFGDGEASFNVPRGKVKAVFEKHGFDGCLKHDDGMKPGSALMKAPSSGGIRKGRGVIVKPIDKHRKDTPAALGVYIKHAAEGEVGDDWIAGARVRIDPTIERAVALPLEGQTTADPKAMKLAEQIAKRANELIENVTNKELSSALTRAGRQTLWATFRSKLGGTWFVYAIEAPRYRALLDELERFGGFWPTIQPLFLDGDARTEKNVRRASEMTLEKELDRLSKDLAKVQQDGMRASSIEKRVAVCDELIARADLYRVMLKDAADTITKRVDVIKAQFERELSGGDGVFDDIEAMLGGSSKYSEAIDALAPEPEPEPEAENDDDLFDIA